MFLGAVSQQNKIKGRGLLVPIPPVTTATFTAADNFQSRVSVELARFRTWAGSTNKLFLGECGIPNDIAGEQTDWNNIIALVAKRCAADNISFTYWASGHEWGTTYELSPYQSSTANPGGVWSNTGSGIAVTSALDYLKNHVTFTGYNYAGNEFGTSESASTAAPSEADFTFHVNKGHSYLRYPIGEPSWTTAWLWTPATNTFVADRLTHVEYVMNRAQATGVKIILDLLHPGGGAKYATIDGSSITNTAAYDEYILYLTALLNHTFNDNNGVSRSLKNHPALYAVDIVNEPQTVAVATWETRSQSILNVLRDAGGINYQGIVMIPLGNYSGIQDLTFNHAGGPWITDSANNFMYEGHYYPEAGHDGAFTSTYAAEVTAASAFAGQGSFDYPV